MVVSADSHAGASLQAYRQYLERDWYDNFDIWAASYVDAWAELDRNTSGVRAGLASTTLETNWNSDLRQASVEGDGIVGEVLFPNTVPPFFPRSSLGCPQPVRSRRIRSAFGWSARHNRWLKDFCAEVPGRRAGVGQILINDVDTAVSEIRAIKQAGLTGGVLLPGVAPGDGLPELFDPAYEPIWDLCEELEVPLNHHGGGSGNPGYVSEAAVGLPVFYVEALLWGHRLLWQLIFSGVFERHPNLKVAFTEQGTGWVAGTLSTLDYIASRLHAASRSPSRPSSAAAQSLTSL